MKTLLTTILLSAISVVGFAQSPTSNAADPVARDSVDVISIYGDT